MSILKQIVLILCFASPALLHAGRLATEIKQQMIWLGTHPILTERGQHLEASIISNKGNTTDLSLRELYWHTYQDEQDLKKLMDTQLENGSWSDINLQDNSRSNWQPANLAANLLYLGRMYATPGSEYYKDKTLSTVLHKGLDFWFHNKPVCKNWWYNDIYIPRTLGLLFLFLEQELSPSEKAEALVVMNHSGFRMTGQNKVWLAGNVLMKALFTDDDSLLKAARDTIASEIFQTTDEGIQPDFSFHQHGPQQQFGNYGLAYLSSMAYYANVFGNSPVAFSPSQIELLRTYLFEGLNAVVWRGRMDVSACNRQLFKQAQRGKALTLCIAATLLQRADSAHTAAYAGLVNRNKTTSATPEAPTSRHFWRSDLTLYRTTDHYLSIRSCSPRVIGTEFTNNENKKGHFLSDGLTLLMRRGDEYDDIFPVWDWNRLPGVTAPILDTIQPKTKTDNYRNPNPFVGGLTRSAHGISTFSLARNGITAKKSWFYSNGVLVCMGCDIQSATGREIVTGVNQVFSKTPTVVFGNAGKRSVFNDKTLALGPIQAVWHDSMAYLFPNQKGVTFSDGIQRGDWHDIADPYPSEKVSAPLFKLWINHGKDASATPSYCYLVKPGLSLEQMDSFLRRKPMPVTINRSDLQLVRFEESKIVAMVFHQPGQVPLFSKKQLLQVLNPGLVLVEQNKGGLLTLTVADPSCSLKSFRLLLSGRFSSPNATYHADKKQTEFIIPLPEKGNSGQSVSVACTPL